VGINPTFKRVLSKKAGIPPDQFDKYFKLALSAQGGELKPENLVLIALTMRMLYHRALRRSNSDAYNR
jgi:hypothetical protein